MGTFAGWMAAVGVMMIALGLGALGALLVMAHRIMEGVDLIIATIHLPDDEDDTPPHNQFVGPSDIPMSRSLMDVLNQPPTDPKDTGTFRGRPPWEPPQPPDDQPKT